MRGAEILPDALLNSCQFFTNPDPKQRSALTRSELITRIASSFSQLGDKDAEVVVKMLLDVMAQSLTLGQRIEIRGFGTFSLNYRPPRVGRNPKSGQEVTVPAKYAPHFRPGKELRERIRGRETESLGDHL
jgi:integration host factor subunit beta